MRLYNDERLDSFLKDCICTVFGFLAPATGAASVWYQKLRHASPAKYDTPTSYRRQSTGNWRQKSVQCVITRMTDAVGVFAGYCQISRTRFTLTTMTRKRSLAKTKTRLSGRCLGQPAMTFGRRRRHCQRPPRHKSPTTEYSPSYDTFPSNFCQHYMPLSASSWFTSSPRSSVLTCVILTTLIVHHPIILRFLRQNFSFSQILPSIDIWHIVGLISRIPGLFYVLFLVLVFFLVSVIVIFFLFSFSISGFLCIP